MVERNQLKFLFNKLEVLSFKYSKIIENERFNIFSVLKKGSDEVNLHSNFIYEILNPQGSHGKADLFLALFLKEVGVDFDSFGKYLFSKTEHKKIDMYFEFEKHILIIENKIYAVDRDKQIERYFTFAKTRNKNVSLFYLTLNGDDPSENSRGNLSDEDFSLISYRHNIFSWLEACIKEVALYPALREVFNQYINLIKYLTGQSMSNDNQREIIELISNANNAKLSLQIVSNWIHVKWYSQYYFWCELESRLNDAGFDVLDTYEQAYSSDNVDGYVHKVRNRKLFYGIAVKLKELVNINCDLCLYIEIGYDNRIYYGITAVRNRIERIKSNIAELESIVSEFSEKGFQPENEWWLTNVVMLPLRFFSFDDELTVSLINKDFRERYIDNLIFDMKLFSNQVLG